jgi:hypothetical protein
MIHLNNWQRNQMLTLPEEMGQLNALKILDISQVHSAVCRPVSIPQSIRANLCVQKIQESFMNRPYGRYGVVLIFTLGDMCKSIECALNELLH